MPRATFVNPFTPQTPIGQGLQNIAIALFANKQGEKDRAARDEMERAHGELYREQARKASAERRLAESLLEARSYDAITDIAAANAGMPGYTFRAIHDATRGMGDLSQYTPDEVARYRRAWAATAPAFAGREVSARDIAQAMLAQQELADRNAIISGGRDPLRTSQAYFATSGKAPFGDFGSGRGSINLLTGANKLNELGVADVGATEALGEQRRAQARKFEEDVRRLAEGLFGPAVFMESEDGGGVTPFFLGQVAGTGRAGARPVTPREPSDTVTITEEPLPPAPINSVINDAIVAGVRAAVGGQLSDPNLEGAIISRAQMYYRTPGSPAYGVPEEAARLAVADVLPEGAENPWLDFSGFQPVGEPRLALPPVPITGPTTKTKQTRKTSSRSGQPVRLPTRTSAPAATQRASHPPRPAGKSDEELIDEANEAVRKGADRNKVLERLQAWGVPVA